MKKKLTEYENFPMLVAFGIIAFFIITAFLFT